MEKIVILGEKVVIIGSSGAGKTTLARKLSRILEIKPYHLDRLFWTRGWQRKCEDTRIDILQKIVREDQWIIEGTYFDFFDLRLNAADTIIFLDMPLLLCLYRVFKRHHEDHGRPRRDIPMECTDKFDWSCIRRVLTFPFCDWKLLVQKLQLECTDKSDWHYVWKVLTFPFRDRRILVKELQCEAGSKQVIRLCSRKAVKEFLAQQSMRTSGIETPSETVSSPYRLYKKPFFTSLFLPFAEPRNAPHRLTAH